MNTITEALFYFANLLDVEPRQSQRDFAFHVDKKGLNFQIQGPCGSGKSLMLIAAILHAVHQGKKAYLATATNDLSEQHCRDLKKAGVKHLRVMGQDNYSCYTLCEKFGIPMPERRDKYDNSGKLKWHSISASNLPSYKTLMNWHEWEDSIVKYHELRQNGYTKDEAVKKLCGKSEKAAKALKAVIRCEANYGAGFLQEVLNNVELEPFYINYRARASAKLIVTNHHYALLMTNWDPDRAFYFDESHKLTDAMRDLLSKSLKYKDLPHLEPNQIRSILFKNKLTGEEKYKKLTRAINVDGFPDSILESLALIKNEVEYTENKKKDGITWAKPTKPRAESHLREVVENLEEPCLMASATPTISWIDTQQFGDNYIDNLTYIQVPMPTFNTGNFDDRKRMMPTREQVSKYLWEPFIEKSIELGMGMVVETSESYFPYYELFALNDDRIELVFKQKGVRAKEFIIDIMRVLESGRTPIAITYNREGLDINIEGVNKALLVPKPFLLNRKVQEEDYGKANHPHYKRDMLMEMEQLLGRVNRNPDATGVVFFGDTDYYHRQYIKPFLD